MNSRSLGFKSKLVSSEVRDATLNAVITETDGDLIKLNPSVLMKEIEAALKQHSATSIQSAGTRFEKSLNMALDDLFFQAEAKVIKVREMLENRVKMIPEAEMVGKLYDDFLATEVNLKQLMRELQESSP